MNPHVLELIEAAEKFCLKVERGEARSVETYRELSEALALLGRPR